MRALGLCAALVSLAGVLPMAQAQGDPGPLDTEHYSFHRVGDAYVRLDLRNGRLAQCGGEAGGWFCRTVPDDRTALEAEIARLLASNAVLKRELLTHGLPLPAGVSPDPQARWGLQEKRSSLPGREWVLSLRDEFARLRDRIQKGWSRLIKMIADLQRDIMPRT